MKRAIMGLGLPLLRFPKRWAPQNIKDSTSDGTILSSLTIACLTKAVQFSFALFGNFVEYYVPPTAVNFSSAACSRSHSLMRARASSCFFCVN